MIEVHALIPAITLLLIGIIAITFTRRIGLSPIVGYLAAGILIGPHAFGLIEESETTHLLAELGVVFLLFDIGLHFTLPSIWEARRDIFGLGPLQIVVCGLVLGGICALFNLALEYALILGGTLALSSTAVVVQTLAERGQRNCPVGLTGIAVLIFQDICAIFILIFAASLGSSAVNPDSGLLSVFALAFGKAAVAFLAAVLIGRYAIKPLFRVLSLTRNEEIFTAMALLVVLATAAATGGAGLSLTLGAFLGGMIISETPHRHVIQTEAKPFRNLLLGFFFITVGMSLDWRIIIAHWPEVLLFLVTLIGIKAVLIAAAAKTFGWSLPGSVQLGFLLAQGSEFVFVIIAMPTVRTALGEGTVGVVITGVAISLALTPTLASLGNRLARKLRERATPQAPVVEKAPRHDIAPVVVLGMNDVGRTVADALEAHGVKYDAIEGEYDLYLRASVDGYPVAYGDPGDIRLMETLAYAERESVIVTEPQQELLDTLSSVLKDRYPTLTIFVTVAAETERIRYESIGLHPVVNRSVPPGMELAAAVLRHQQADEESIETWMQRQQERVLETTNLIGAAHAVD